MMAMYKLKKPIFCSFEYDGSARVEVITHITCAPRAEGVERPRTAPTEGFCDHIVSYDHDLVELAVELHGMDIENGVRNAYLSAKWRAENYFAAIAMDKAHLDEVPIDIERFKGGRLLTPRVD